MNKTGSGIWLHGLPKDVEQRPRLDSDGCVVIDNGSLQEMGEYIRTGLTHVVLTVGEMKWQPATAVLTQERELETAFEAWRQAWEAIDNDTYLSYYSHDFRASNRNKTQWDEYKKRVNGGKSSIRVEVSSQSMFANPEAPELISVRYYQRYRSDNYSWRGWKEQIWRKDDTAGWQIVYEGKG